MLWERLKSSAIVILIANLIYMTSYLWFFNQNHSLNDEMVRYFRSIPIVEKFFPVKQEYSISKENLSKPRKFLINDGSLWMAYYNTDIGFSPIEQRTKKILTGFLEGNITASKKIDYQTWESGLESMSIYVEYPVAFPLDVLSRIMGADETNRPDEINTFRELIIIPSSSETNICILIRDAEDESLIYAYILDDSHSLPASDLSVYASNDGYYEPVFSTGLELGADSKVTLSPLVLFSDSQPTTEVLEARDLITSTSKNRLLENFSFNTVAVNPYEDTYGALNYIANYASAKIYPDSVFEYTAVEESKGIILDESGDAYNVLNASIDFAEKTWATVSGEPLSILVTSDLSGYDSSKPYTFRFDYYESGRPIEVSLAENYGHSSMKCAIEMTVSGGRLISYRQYMRSYRTVSIDTISDTFVTALDSFVHAINSDPAISRTVIDDIYIGYLDLGTENQIHATWLAQTSDGKIYRYSKDMEVVDNALE